MDYLTALGGMALLLGTVLYLGYPLLAADAGVPARGPADATRRLLERKEQVYAAIGEIDFDHALGKLPAEDHARYRRLLETEAVDLLRQLDELAEGTESSLRARIRKDVAAVRLTADPGPGTCPACGARPRGGQDVCPECGAALRGDAAS